MKNKLMLIIVLIMSFVLVKTDVFAEATAATFEQEPDYSQLKQKYEGSISKTTVSTGDFVTIYGKSVCNGTSCNHIYQGGESDFKNILSKAVTCSGGESYITYGDQPSSGKDDFKDNNNNIINGDAYWSEEYYVTCTSDSSGSNTVLVDNSNTGNSGSSNDSGNSGSSGNYGNTGDSDYDSSTPGDTSETGVTTYFITLSLVALVSYACMILVKKYNVIKKI